MNWTSKDEAQLQELQRRKADTLERNREKVDGVVAAFYDTAMSRGELVERLMSNAAAVRAALRDMDDSLPSVGP